MKQMLIETSYLFGLLCGMHVVYMLLELFGKVAIRAVEALLP